jgi:lipopolysaccharide transport system permease protein
MFVEPQFTEVRIAPSRGWWRVEWLQIWHYRDLLVLLVRRDFFARYAQSVLGPAWFVIQPVLTTLVFTVVFGQIAKIPTGGVPPMLFYLCNQLGWLYFSGSFSAVSGTFLGNQHLFSKVYFPRLVVPLANLLGNLIPVVIQGLSFLAFWCWFYFSADAPSFHFTAWALMVPVAFLHLAFLALGFGLCMAALTAKYRDLAQLSGILVQLWMYASPVIFPLGGVPLKWRWILEINPVTLPLELIRLGLLGSGTIDLRLVLLSCAGTVLVLIAGLSLFSRVEKDFVDVI